MYELFWKLAVTSASMYWNIADSGRPRVHYYCTFSLHHCITPSRVPAEPGPPLYNYIPLVVASLLVAVQHQTQIFWDCEQAIVTWTLFRKDEGRQGDWSSLSYSAICIQRRVIQLPCGVRGMWCIAVNKCMARL